MKLKKCMMGENCVHPEKNTKGVPEVDFKKNRTTDDGLKRECKYCMKYFNDKYNNPLKMTFKEKELLPIWKVYEHFDESGITVYRGKGCDGREGDALNRRQPDHAAWCLEQLLKKREYIRLADKHMLGQAAKDLEKKLNKQDKPKFNGKRRNNTTSSGEIPGKE